MKRAEAEARVREIRGLLSPGGTGFAELIDRLDRLVVEAGRSSKRLGIVGARGPERTSSARFAVELLDDPEALSRRASCAEDLAVIEWALRPAVPVIAGSASLGRDRWRALDGRDLSAITRHLCRLDIGDGPDGRLQAGSGVLVAGNDGCLEVVTAAHIVVSMRAIGWDPDRRPRAYAVRGEDPSDERSAAISVSGVRSVDFDRDLAVLSTTHENGDVDVLRCGPSPPENAPIAVLGYPFFDSRLDPWAYDFGFREPAGVLRISPGLSLGIGDREWRGRAVEVLSHDASTLSGSSGSAIVELPSLRLVGLHVGGWPDLTSPQQRYERNAAIPVDGFDRLDTALNESSALGPASGPGTTN